MTHTPTFETEWINGSVVRGRQLGFLYWRCVCSCGEKGWGGNRRSQHAWWRRHFLREMRRGN